jgi:hypothetical protein
LYNYCDSSRLILVVVSVVIVIPTVIVVLWMHDNSAGSNALRLSENGSLLELSVSLSKFYKNF